MIRALFRKQLQELFAAFVRSGRTGRRRTRGQRVGYAALFLALLLVLMVCFGAMALPLSAALVPQGGDWLYFASMELIHARLVRTTTCANGCKCDYTICGDKDPYLNDHPEYRDEAGYRRNR